MAFRHSHSLGQNFLSDGNLLSAIAADAELSAGDTAVEVGAGMGALTLRLAPTGARVCAYEIDERLKEYLLPLEQAHPNVTVTFGDFMKCDLPPEVSYKAVANLPYYITTPVLFRFLDDPRCSSVTVMVQQEVAERMIAPPGGKDYGALSVAAQLSGGEQQRAALARALATDPKLIFLDEPTGSLDKERGRQVMELLARINREKGVALVMVTHSAAHAAYASRRIELEDGRIVKGSAEF